MAFLKLPRGAINLDFIRMIDKLEDGTFEITTTEDTIIPIVGPESIRAVEAFLEAGDACAPGGAAGKVYYGLWNGTRWLMRFDGNPIAAGSPEALAGRLNERGSGWRIAAIPDFEGPATYWAGPADETGPDVAAERPSWRDREPLL